MIPLDYSNPLGKLKIKDVFEFYDFPRLFSAVDKIGSMFLGLSILEEDDTLEWLYVNISRDRMNAILDNKITLYDAFKNPEKSFLYRVQTDFEKELKFNCILPESISEDLLPEQEMLLDADVNKSGFLGDRDEGNS